MNQYLSRQTRIENLKKVQSTRKEDSLHRVYEAIKRLEKIGAKINFNTVAREASVSVSYLYKYPELKQHIAELRNKQSFIPRPSLAKPVETSSHFFIIGRFKQRIQQLEEQNRELRRKNEALAGQVYRVHHLQATVERLSQTIENLENKLRADEKRPHTPPLSSLDNYDVASRSEKKLNKSGDDDKIKLELSALKIKINSTLSKFIEQAPEEVVLTAISALKEAIATTNVRSRSGFLVTAIKNAWIPNENYEKKLELDAFNQWYPLARSQGLVEAATQIDGVQHVCTPDGEWIKFDLMAAEYPLEQLR